jgi:hypothetical protein
MKIVLIFNLPEEAGWAEDAQKGSAYRAARPFGTSTTNFGS